LFDLAVENLQSSSILQQSVHQMQQSFHNTSTSPSSKFEFSFKSILFFILATFSSLHNSSIPNERMHTLVNTSHPMTQSKSDIPNRSLAQFGVLSRLHSQVFNLPDTTSLSRGAPEFDMNVSCLFMHEVNHLSFFPSFFESKFNLFSFDTSTDTVNMKH